MKIPKRILERRRSVRIEESLPFKIGHSGYNLEAHSLNISSHGVMCVIDHEIPMMTQVNVGLTLPAPTPQSKDRQIRTKGVVVRKEKDEASGKFFIAIYFSQIKDSDQKTLNDYIENRLSK